MNILKDTPEAQRIISDKLEDGEVVILPSNGVYTLNTNIFNNNSIEKIFMLKEKDEQSPLTVVVKDYDMAQSLINIEGMSEKERQIIELLIQNFWPGMLTIVVKTNQQNPVYTMDGYISIESPCHKSVQNILGIIEKPIISTSANISNKASCSHISHVKNYFKDIDNITVLEPSKNPKYGIETTILKIENETHLSILRPGSITKSDIYSLLEENDIHTSIEYKETISHGVSKSHYGIDKNSVLANFITSDKLDETINKLTKKYLSESVLIDFGKKNIEKYSLCAGYVDLSSNGVIEEALFNLYDVLHQLNNLEIKNIIFIDLYKNNDDLYKTMYNKLDKICNKNILIPLYYN